MTQELITLAHAAKLVDTSTAALRKLVHDGKIPAKKMPGKRDNYVALDDVLGALRHRSGAISSSRSSSVHERSDPLAESLKEQIALLTRLLESERQAHAESRALIRELERERTQHLAEMRAILNPTGKLTEVSRWVRDLVKK